MVWQLLCSKLNWHPGVSCDIVNLLVYFMCTDRDIPVVQYGSWWSLLGWMALGGEDWWNGTFVVFVFVFLDRYVVTVVGFFPFVLKFTVKNMFYMYKFCGILALCFCFHCTFGPVRKNIMYPVTLPTNEIYRTIHNAVFSCFLSEECAKKFVTC